MKRILQETKHADVPKRQKHYSYNESLDEPASLISHEPTDVEGETPAEDNEPIEAVEQNSAEAARAFEE